MHITQEPGTYVYKIDRRRRVRVHKPANFLKFWDTACMAVFKKHPLNFRRNNSRYRYGYSVLPFPTRDAVPCFYFWCWGGVCTFREIQAWFSSKLARAKRARPSARSARGFDLVGRRPNSRDFFSKGKSKFPKFAHIRSNLLNPTAQSFPQHSN